MPAPPAGANAFSVNRAIAAADRPQDCYPSPLDEQVAVLLERLGAGRIDQEERRDLALAAPSASGSKSCMKRGPSLSSEKYGANGASCSVSTSGAGGRAHHRATRAGPAGLRRR